MGKRNHILLSMLVSVMVSSCTMETMAVKSSITVRLASSTAVTRNVVDRDDIQSADICLWDDTGNLYCKRRLEGNTEVTIDSLIPGRYDISVISGSSSYNAQTFGELRRFPVTLADAEGEDGLLESGFETITADGSFIEADVMLTRYLSRIRVTKILNSIVGTAITLKGVMLTNVPAVWTVDADGAPDGWCNLAGRVAGEIIDFSTAQVPSLTYREFDEHLEQGESFTGIPMLYCFPNNIVEDSFGPQAKSGKLRLVVIAEIDGRKTYYPVTVAPNDGMFRNTSYDVELTLLSFGSDDPNILSPEGALTVRMDVEGYDNIEYDDTI